jgi:hypothetical protein
MAWTTGASIMPNRREDDCEPDSNWQDFKDFAWFQAQLVFWAVTFYVFVQFVYSFTGRST